MEYNKRSKTKADLYDINEEELYMAFVTLEQKGPVGIITMNRPEALNALNEQVLKDLDEVLDQVEQNEEILVAIVTGAGRSFVAGADIGQMSGLTSVEGKAFGAFGNRVFLKLENLSKPTIAAVNGFALGGGCELSMACDIRLASEKAKFGQPEVGLGITPGFGGTQRLPRIVGISNAMELILTARTISAAEAKELGLVSHVYAPEELLDKAVELANAIAANAQIAVRQSKAAIRRGMQTDIATGTAYETEAFGLCFSTEDQKDAMKAFVNKEKVTSFKNR
jgi:enoyl-CoA hydratase